MNINIQQLQNNLCQLLCSDIRIQPKNNALAIVETPFYFPDGDPYQIYIREMPGGILRLSDMGHTMMHLSFDNNIDKFHEGTRGNLFNQVLAETFINETEGEFYIDTTYDNIATSIFKLAHALIKINDLTFLNRARAESTFYDDLKENLFNLISSDKIHEDFIYGEISNAADYPIDYYIEGKFAPLYLFGIPNKDKARLTTIILERLLRADPNFESLLIFADQKNIPRADLARLSNTGGEQIASLDASDDFKRKLLRKVA